MARIRTIKPEFFTSEDIVALTPFARLLYIALWCEADKAGRLMWKPKTFKMRYLPADTVDIEALCLELVSSGLVVLYGDGLAVIPKFTSHQHINPREADSQLPEPDASFTRAARVNHASTTRQPRDSDAQGGREGKGKEGKEIDASDTRPPDEPAPSARRCRLPAGFEPNEDGRRKAVDAHLDVSAELDAFRNHHTAHGTTMLDWQAAWRTWIGKAVEFGRGKPPPKSVSDVAPKWATVAGFASVFEAHNAGCREHNARQFRDGKRIAEAA